MKEITLMITALLPALPALWLVWKTIKKCWRAVLILFFLGASVGCTSTSNKFDQSPCACAFEQINAGDYGENPHV